VHRVCLRQFWVGRNQKEEEKISFISFKNCSHILLLLRSRVGDANAEGMNNAGDRAITLDDVVGHQDRVAVLPLAPGEKCGGLHRERLHQRAVEQCSDLGAVSHKADDKGSEVNWGEREREREREWQESGEIRSEQPKTGCDCGAVLTNGVGERSPLDNVVPRLLSVHVHKDGFV